jgi:hypothetical protein
MAAPACASSTAAGVSIIKTATPSNQGKFAPSSQGKLVRPVLIFQANSNKPPSQARESQQSSTVEATTHHPEPCDAKDAVKSTVTALNEAKPPVETTPTVIRCQLASPATSAPRTEHSAMATIMALSKAHGNSMNLIGGRGDRPIITLRLANKEPSAISDAEQTLTNAMTRPDNYADDDDEDDDDDDLDNKNILPGLSTN